MLGSRLAGDLVDVEVEDAEEDNAEKDEEVDIKEA